MQTPPKIYVTYFGEIKTEAQVKRAKSVIDIINSSDIEINYWFETNWANFVKKNVVNGIDKGVLAAIFTQRERFLDIIRLIEHNASGLEKYSAYELNFFKDFYLEDRTLSKKPIKERISKLPPKKGNNPTSQLSLFD